MSYNLCNISHFEQDQVPEFDRCIVGGVQNSLQSSMDLMGYVMGIIISNPQVIYIQFMTSCNLVKKN